MQVAEKHHIGSNRASEWLHSVMDPVILFGIFVLAFWKLVLTDQYTWLEGPDSAYQVLPWLQYQAGEWHAGRFPLWDPHHWGGQSLIGQAQPGAAYPPNWLLFLMPLKNGWMRQSAVHWYFVIIHFQAGLFCYWLCRDLGRSRLAAILAGSMFGLAGWMGSTDWPQMLNGAVWAPAVFLFFCRMIRGERPLVNAAWSGACLGIAFLSGHHQIPVFVALAVGGAWIFYLLKDGRPKLERLRLAAVFGLFLVLLSALQTLPAYEYGKLSLRWVGAKEAVGWKQAVPYHVHQTYSMQPQSLLGIILPGFHQHANPYMGFAALLLALIAIVAAWRDRFVKLFAMIALGGILLALGYNSFVHGLAYVLVPIVEKARTPSMAILVFHFGLSILLAYGIDHLQDVSRRFAAVSLSIALVLTLSQLALTLSAVSFPDRAAVGIFASFAVSATLMTTAWRILPVSMCAGVLTVVALLEAGNVTGFGFPHRDHVTDSLIKKLSLHGDIADFLRKQPQPMRVEIDDREIPYNFGDWHGMDQLGGYLASLSSNAANAQSNLKLRRLFASAFWVGKEPNNPSQRDVFTSQTGLKVFQNPEAFPRAWTVHSATPYVRNEEIPGIIDHPEFDLRKSVFLRAPAPSLETCTGSDVVWFITQTPSLTVLEADMKCGGMLVVGDTWAPGWTATVDGKTERVHEAYSFLRGVVVDAGRHRVQIKYRPMSVYTGASLTAFGALAAIALRLSRVQ